MQQRQKRSDRESNVTTCGVCPNQPSDFREFGAVQGGGPLFPTCGPLGVAGGFTIGAGTLLFYNSIGNEALAARGRDRWWWFYARKKRAARRGRWERRCPLVRWILSTVCVIARTKTPGFFLHKESNLANCQWLGLRLP